MYMVQDLVLERLRSLVTVEETSDMPETQTTEVSETSDMPETQSAEESNTEDR